jgi:hypothetical protein
MALARGLNMPRAEALELVTADRPPTSNHPEG